MALRFGIDLGGTKTEIIVLDDKGDTLVKERRPTEKQDYKSLLTSLINFIKDIEKEIGQEGKIGIAIPGAISPYSKKIKNANTVCLIGQDFKSDLEKKLNREVRLSNDANCFALSEAVDGAGENANLIFGVILGTGVGGGIVFNQGIWEGSNRIGGEWGHNPLPWASEEELSEVKCYCGKSGCIETFLSGPGLSNDFFIQTGINKCVEEIIELERQNDEDAIEVMQRYYDRLTRAIASVVNILDPDVIVLGGGLSNIPQLYKEIPERWMQYVFSDHIETKIVKAKYGDSSGVRGAAWLWE